MIATKSISICMLLCIITFSSLVTCNLLPRSTPRPFITTTFPTLTTTRSLPGFELQTTNVAHPHYTYPAFRRQSSSAVCTTEFYQPPPIEFGPTKTIYADTTTSTRWLTCGGCSLTILDPFPGDTGGHFTTTVSITATRTINTAKCMETTAAGTVSVTEATGTEVPQPTGFSPPIFCPPGTDIPGCSTTESMPEPSAGTPSHSTKIETRVVRRSSP